MEIRDGILVVSAAAFHLAGFAARSFSMSPSPALTKNLASPERALLRASQGSVAVTRIIGGMQTQYTATRLWRRVSSMEMTVSARRTRRFLR